MAFHLIIVTYIEVTMKSNRPLIRRTFSHERFDILIKKQRNGYASFNDLTELDEIVNRDPEIRESILEEIQEQNKPTDGPLKHEIVIITNTRTRNFFEKAKEFMGRLFIVIEARDLKLALNDEQKLVL